MNKDIQKIIVVGIGLFAAYKFFRQLMPQLNTVATQAARQNALKAKRATSAAFNQSDAQVIDVTPM